MATARRFLGGSGGGIVGFFCGIAWVLEDWSVAAGDAELSRGTRAAWSAFSDARVSSSVFLASSVGLPEESDSAAAELVEGAEGVSSAWGGGTVGGEVCPVTGGNKSLTLETRKDFCIPFRQTTSVSRSCPEAANLRNCSAENGPNFLDPRATYN